MIINKCDECEKFDGYIVPCEDNGYRVGKCKDLTRGDNGKIIICYGCNKFKKKGNFKITSI